MRRCEVLVVGGGAVGAATAWQLAARGADVVLLERWSPGHHHGSSHGATRIFRLAYDTTHHGAMAVEAGRLWRQLEEESGQVLLEVTGGLDLGDEQTIAGIEANLSHLGQAHERVSAADAADRWPGFAVDGRDDVILFSPDAGRLWAERAVQALHDAAAARGCEVRTDEPALTIDAPTGHVATERDEYVAETVVLTAGAWTPGLLATMPESYLAGLPPFAVTR